MDKVQLLGCRRWVRSYEQNKCSLPNKKERRKKKRPPSHLRY